MALPADFSKIYGATATGGLTPISDVNYAKGWEFVGSIPPTKNDFSYLQNLSDLKSQWLYSNKLQRTDPFGDIKSDGTVETALENLRLGDLGTASRRNVGTGANQIPDMSYFTNGNQYFYLPGGTLVQYSYAEIIGPGPWTLAFPIAFPNACRSIVMTDAGAGAFSPGAQVLSNTQFNAYSKAPTGQKVGFHFICIGS